MIKATHESVENSGRIGGGERCMEGTSDGEVVTAAVCRRRTSAFGICVESVTVLCVWCH